MQGQHHPSGFNVPHSGIDSMRGLADSLSQMLRMTRALVAGGRSVDITGLDRQIGLLCDKTLDLPPEDGRTLRPLLVSLLTDLDALSSAVINQASTQPTPLPDS
jgi:hypothetical protein